MRRSNAPSSRKSIPIASSSTSTTSNINDKTKMSENVRSVKNIINLLEQIDDSEMCITTSETSTNLSSSNRSILPAALNIQQSAKENQIYYNIVWGKRSTKKHKTWEGDGILEINSNSKRAIAKDLNGKCIGTITIKSNELESGEQFIIGNNEIEIIDRNSNYNLVENKTSVTRNSTEYDCSDDVDDAEKPQKKLKLNQTIFRPNLILSNSNKKIYNRTTTTNTLKNYEPLIMPKPNYEHQWKYNTEKRTITEVSIVPCLARELREHQRYGVKFLYECCMGFKTINNNEIFGCILADEMGLGKTLQCITVCYTLLKQGPYGKNMFKRVLIITPSSLCENWNKEIDKWLGKERIQTFLINGKHQLEEYVKYNHIPFLIISYEMFTKHHNILNDIQFDILVCDEGHRLKNDTIKCAQSLNKLDCKRRIILTGTPIQNDLQEYYSLINFVNPNCLGTYNEYKQYYENPIVNSQQPNMLPSIIEFGEQRAQELNEITSKFILRRTQNIIRKYLPKKQEFVIFCKPSELQIKLTKETLKYYENQCAGKEILDLDKDITALEIIMLLKKICNHPSLLQQQKLSTSTTPQSLIMYLQSQLPPLNEMGAHDSVKLLIVEHLLIELLKLREKVVLISYYQKTLNMFEELCNFYNYKFCRLDGGTVVSNRQKIVDQFNNPNDDTFIFLLSARAGGIGLNLIGASRLILYDNDWNPATDLQAMSRIWRDGQKKSVYIYRLLTSGTIEEKIFQRQLSKSSLSDSVSSSKQQYNEFSSHTNENNNNNNNKKLKLSDSELKDLFTITSNFDICGTHELLQCNCSGDGHAANTINNTSEPVGEPVGDNPHQIQLFNTENTINSLQMHELMLWQHYKSPIEDNLLESLCLTNCQNNINFIFRNQNNI